MRAAILIVLMISLLTGALSLGLMIGRRLITCRGDPTANRLYLTNITGNGPKGAGLGNREVLYAFNSTRGGPDRGGCASRAGESLYTDGRIYQIDPEWGCGHRRSSLAAKYFWTLQFAVRDPCGQSVLARRDRRLSRDRIAELLCNGDSEIRNYRLCWFALFLLLVLAVSPLAIAFTPAAKAFAGTLSRHSLGLRSLGAQETGREVALPLFRELMLRVYRDKLVAPVPRFPAQMEQNINDYLAAGPVHTGEFMSALHRENPSPPYSSWFEDGSPTGQR